MRGASILCAQPFGVPRVCPWMEEKLHAITEPVAKPGRNCWRVERADRVKVIVDAADYYHILHDLMLKADKRILLIGWDFDTRIDLERGHEADGTQPETLGAFMLRLAKTKPHLAIDILKWDFGAIKSLFRGSHLLTLLRWMLTKQITFKFDSAHPKGCSHHQKIVVIDDCIAVCGGIDMTGARWDTPEHQDDDPRRKLPNGKVYTPWHDVTTLIDGPVAEALAELGRERWKLATTRELKPVHTDCPLWPDDLEPDFTDVDLAVSRTRAEYKDLPEIREIEKLYIDMIAAAKRYIYCENQYFTAPEIAAAIARRMQEENPPEIVIVMPQQADGWIEQTAMDGARVRLCQAIGNIDTGNRFRIFYPVTQKGEPIYVHAKLMIVDDQLLRIGSSNMNNRSLGLDSECDIMLQAEAGSAQSEEIAALRTSLMAEHLDVAPEEIAAKFAETGSLLETIYAFQKPAGRSLRTLEVEEPDGLDKFIADNEILDPKSADGFFEPMSRRGLFKGFRKRVAEMRGRRKGLTNYWESDRTRFCYAREDKSGETADKAEAEMLTD